MNISDPIADMLTRIRNASRARHDGRAGARLAHQARDRRDPERRGLHRRASRSTRTARIPSSRSRSSTSGKVPVISGLKRDQQARPARLRGQDGHPARARRPGRRHRQHQPRDHDRPAGPPGASSAAKSWPTSGRSTCHESADLPFPVPSRRRRPIDGSHVAVKGPKGELERDFAPEMRIVREDGDAARRAALGRRSARASSTA